MCLVTKEVTKQNETKGVIKTSVLLTTITIIFLKASSVYFPNMFFLWSSVLCWALKMGNLHTKQTQKTLTGEKKKKPQAGYQVSSSSSSFSVSFFWKAGPVSCHPFISRGERRAGLLVCLLFFFSMTNDQGYSREKLASPPPYTPRNASQGYRLGLYQHGGATEKRVAKTAPLPSSKGRGGRWGCHSSLHL